MEIMKKAFWRKAFALMTVLALVIMNIPIASAEGQTITIYQEDFENGPGAAVKSGGANLEWVTGKVFDGNPNGTAVYVSNRVNNWDAADFYFNAVGMENGKTYTVTVKGYVDEDAVVPAGAQAWLQTIGSYKWWGGANFVPGQAFILTGQVTVDTSKDNRLRIQSNDSGANVPFYIGSIIITTIEEISAGDDEEPDVPAADPFTTITFEDQTTGGFVGRSGTEILTVTNEANHTPGGSYSLKVENRTNNWHGPALRVERFIDKGKEYKISAWVKLIEPQTAQLQLSTQIGDGGGATYQNVARETVRVSDGWVKLEGTYRYSSVASGFITIYVESPNSATASFYIDDVEFVPTGSGPVTIQKELIPIKNVYQNHFMIGNIMTEQNLDGIRLDLLKMHHNSLTAENAMKPDALQPTKGNFTFSAADAMVNKAIAEGFQVYGHVLVWHQQTPAWMNRAEDGSFLSREEALENMRNHIKTVVEHFGERVVAWDVVNEAMIDNPPNPSDWRASLRKSPWYYAIGDDYVEQAFLAAREVLDEKGWNIALYYNDYNDDNQNKATAIYNMVKEINERYAQTHNGKLLIDGVGMQSHYNMSTNPENVRLSLQRFISLGVKVSITELDIQAGSNSQLTSEQAKAQAYLYAQLFKIYKEHAEHIERVTFWGLDDGSSWRAATSPLVFDRNLQAKPAYYAVIDPDKYIQENPPAAKPDTRESLAMYGTPVIDGDVDNIWNKAPVMQINRYQMAWQGATGTAKALWDENNLYVLVQVNDSELDKANLNPWEQDSIEIFVDENNAKTSFYQSDDGQFRVNFDNETSFNPAGIDNGFESAVKVSGTNYIVEVKIPFRTIAPQDDIKIGFDVQINDAKNGSRQSVATWNDTSGNAYQDTSVFGILTLKKEAFQPQPDTGSDPSVPASDPGSVVDSTGSITPVVLFDAITKTASAYVDNATILQAIKNAGQDSMGRKSIVLQIPPIQNAKEYVLSLPAKFLSESEGNTRFVVKTQYGEVILPSSMISYKNINDETQVSLTISPADVYELHENTRNIIGNKPILSLSIKIDGKPYAWNNPDAPARVIIPYNPSNNEIVEPEHITVWYIDGNGNTFDVPSGRYDPRTSTVSFITTHFSKFAVVYVKRTFSDLSNATWAQKAIEVLASKGIVRGISDKEYAPKANITRADFLHYLIRTLGIDSKIDGNFDDISDDAYYYKEIAIAKKLGITKGTGNNKFNPDAAITRQDMMVLTHRALRILDKLKAEETDKILDKFADKSSISDYAVKSVVAVVNEGLIVGDGRNIKPRDNTTRAEAAMLLYRVYNK